MKISDVVENIKKYHAGYGKIDERETRDKILWGNIEQECKGIVTTCWATVEVIKEAIKLGANLIICHEALFWNRGDHTEWLELQNNETYLAKKLLLEKANIVVWRNHDYIHSGIPFGDGEFIDGIFYGVAKELKWESYIIKDKNRPYLYKLPEMTVGEVADHIMKTFNLNGGKLIGKLDSKIKKVYICAHIVGDNNNEISKVEIEDIDLLLPLELIDYTLSEYIKDSSELGRNKAILAFGHFNFEEPGMKYMLEYIHEAIGEAISAHFVQSGDMYSYVTNN